MDSIIRRIEPISNIVAPIKAVIPPPYNNSLLKVVGGLIVGRKTKKALNTLLAVQYHSIVTVNTTHHTILPQVNKVATHQDISQYG